MCTPLLVCFCSAVGYNSYCTRPNSIPDRVASLTTTSSNPPTIHIIWVPKSTLVTHHVLEQAGVLADPLTYDLPLYFMPLADDVLSLEDYTAFQDLYKVNLFEKCPV